MSLSALIAGSPFGQAAAGWLGSLATNYPSHYPSDYAQSYPRVGAGDSPAMQPSAPWLEQLAANYPADYPADYPQSYPRVGAGDSPPMQPSAPWLEQQAANYPSDYPADYPQSYPRVGNDIYDIVGCGAGCIAGGQMMGMQSGDVAEIIGAAHHTAVKLAQGKKGLWLRVNILQEGHFMVGRIYTVTDGKPNVVTVKVDLRPLYKAAVRMYRRKAAALGPAVVGVRIDKWIGRQAKKLTRDIGRSKAFRQTKDAYIKTTRVVKTVARSPLVPAIAAGITYVFPPAAIVTGPVIAAWTYANVIVDITDRGEAVVDDVKNGEVGWDTVQNAAGAINSGSSVATGGRVDLGAELSAATSSYTQQGQDFVNRLSASGQNALSELSSEGRSAVSNLSQSGRDVLQGLDQSAREQVRAGLNSVDPGIRAAAELRFAGSMRGRVTPDTALAIVQRMRSTNRTEVAQAMKAYGETQLVPGRGSFSSSQRPPLSSPPASSRPRPPAPRRPSGSSSGRIKIPSYMYGGGGGGGASTAARKGGLSVKDQARIRAGLNSKKPRQRTIAAVLLYRALKGRVSTSVAATIKGGLTSNNKKTFFAAVDAFKKSQLARSGGSAGSSGPTAVPRVAASRSAVGISTSAQGKIRELLNSNSRKRRSMGGVLLYRALSGRVSNAAKAKIKRDLTSNDKKTFFAAVLALKDSQAKVLTKPTTTARPSKRQQAINRRRALAAARTTARAQGKGKPGAVYDPATRGRNNPLLAPSSPLSRTSGRVNPGISTSAMQKITKLLRSTSSRSRSQGAYLFGKSMRGRASTANARKMRAGLVSKNPATFAGALAAYTASQKQKLSATPGIAAAQGQQKVARKFMMLKPSARPEFLRVTANDARGYLLRGRGATTTAQRAAMAGALSAVKAGQAALRGDKARAALSDPKTRAAVKEERAKKLELQRQLRTLKIKARYAKGPEKLKAMKALAMLQLAQQNNQRIAQNVENNAGGIPSMLIDQKGHITPGRYSTRSSVSASNPDILYRGPNKDALSGQFARVGYALPPGAFPIDGHYSPAFHTGR